MTKINFGDNTLNLDILAIEKYYGAKYVGEFAVPNPTNEDEYLPYPASIFHRPKNLVNTNNSEYFGITGVSGKSFYVINANYITKYIFNGLQWGDEVIYSRFADDKRTFENAAFISGGFTKREWDAGSGVPAKLVRLQVVDGRLTILKE